MKASNKSRSVIVWGAALAIAFATFAAIQFSRSSSGPPLPNPNGYDDIIAAGKMLNGDWPSTNHDMGVIRGYVESNNAALALIDRGLTREIRAPIEFSKSFMSSNMTEALKGSKYAANALCARGKLDEMEGRFHEAASNYVDTIKLALEIQRGGVLIHCLVQIAIERMGTVRLEHIIPDLNAQESSECLRALTKELALRESFEEFRNQETAFVYHELLENPLKIASVIADRQITTRTEKTAQQMYAGDELALIRLQLHLAEHAFRLDKGRSATNWNDLVPTYLPAVPNDPTATNQPMKFTALQ